MSRQRYHVTYKNEQWQVKLPEASRASATAPTKAEAIERGKELAKAVPLGQLIVHKIERNQIQTEWTYGKDPRKTVG